MKIGCLLGYCRCEGMIGTEPQALSFLRNGKDVASPWTAFCVFSIEIISIVCYDNVQIAKMHQAERDTYYDK